MAITLKVGEARPAFTEPASELRSRAIALLEGMDIEDTENLLPLLSTLLRAAGLRPIEAGYTVSGSVEVGRLFKEDVAIDDEVLQDAVIGAAGQWDDGIGYISVESGVSARVRVEARLRGRAEVRAVLRYSSVPTEEDIAVGLLNAVEGRDFGDWEADIRTLGIDEVEAHYS